MSRHRYRSDALRGDAIRAAVGAGFCALALVLAWSAPWARWIFLAMTLFFLAFAVRILLRWQTEFELTESHLGRSIGRRKTPESLPNPSSDASPNGVGKSSTVEEANRGHTIPTGTVLSWEHLDRLRLRYYSTRRDRSDGWMTLTLAGLAPSGRRVRLGLDSTVDGFIEIARAAAAAAVRNGVALKPSTVANLNALDIRLDRLSGQTTATTAAGETNAS